MRCFIALLLGLLAYLVIDSQYSYWILLSVLLLLPSTTGATIQKAVKRVIGTLLGVLIGLLIVVLLPPNMLLYLLIILLSLFLTTYLSKSYYALAMFFAAIMVIMALTYFVAHGSVMEAWNFVIARFFDTLLAAIIVIVTAYIFWPERTGKKLKQTILTLEDQIHTFLQTMFTAKQSEGFHSCHQQLVQLNTHYYLLKELYAQLQHEPNNDLYKFFTIASIIKNIYLLKNNLTAIYNCWQDAQHFLQEHPEVVKILNTFIISLNQLKIGQQQNTLNDDSFYVLANTINNLQEENLSIFVQKKSNSLAVLLIALRDIVINLEFISIATSRMR